VEGPIPAKVTPWEAVEARQGSIENLSGLLGLREYQIADVLRRCAMMGTRVTPLLGRWIAAAGDSGEVQRAYRLTERARRAGVEILAGTGSGTGGPAQGPSLHEELELLVTAGLTTREALEAATVAPPRMLGWDGVLGTVAAGRLADVVLLDANPLEDIRNTRRIAGVFAGGRYYSRAVLEKLRTPGAP
jgi:imidazolonepropionase-like amidohydrolase